jgi:hypothetical protein
MYDQRKEIRRNEWRRMKKLLNEIVRDQRNECVWTDERIYCFFNLLMIFF